MCTVLGAGGYKRELDRQVFSVMQLGATWHVGCDHKGICEWGQKKKEVFNQVIFILVKTKTKKTKNGWINLKSAS